MTFEEFQSTRHRSADLRIDLGDESWPDEPVAPTGFVYLDSLHIDDVLPHWPDSAKRKGRFYLLLENHEYISDHLGLLERKLYQWALMAGYGDNDHEQAS